MATVALHLAWAPNRTSYFAVMKGFCVRSGLARELVKGTNLILEEYKPTRGKKLVISGWAGGWVT